MTGPASRRFLDDDRLEGCFLSGSWDEKESFREPARLLSQSMIYSLTHLPMENGKPIMIIVDYPGGVGPPFNSCEEQTERSRCPSKLCNTCSRFTVWGGPKRLTRHVCGSSWSERARVCGTVHLHEPLRTSRNNWKRMVDRFAKENP